MLLLYLKRFRKSKICRKCFLARMHVYGEGKTNVIVLCLFSFCFCLSDENEVPPSIAVVLAESTLIQCYFSNGGHRPMAKHPYPLPTSDTVSRRTFLSKSALTVGSLTTAGLLLDACGSTASTNTGTGHRTLNVMYDSADTLIGKQLLSQFEQENNCTVSVTKFDQIRLNASLASGSPPDIVRSAGASEMPNLIARGLAENLDPYFAKSTVFKADDLDPVTGV